MSNIKSTPMMEQYLSIKKNYSDILLLYRMGDFYEMFYEDAEIASKDLKIVLTSRNKNERKAIPMCGFPYRSASSYIAKLIKKGHKVAICDQVGAPSKNKGLVDRKVVRVITPGMIIDNHLLEEKQNNFILSLNYYQKIFGISFLDISTGSFFLTEALSQNDILEEIIRISPSEIIVANSIKKKSIFIELENITGSHISFVSNSWFYLNEPSKRLLSQFSSTSFEEINKEMKAGIGSAGALIKYIYQTQSQIFEHIKPIKPYYLEDYLVIDKQSSKNLELFCGIQSETRTNSLISILDKTVTSMGGRLLNNWIRYPLLDQNKINERYDAISEIIDKIELISKIQNIIKLVCDLERVFSKLFLGNINARDLNSLNNSIKIIPNLLEILSSLSSKIYHFSNNFEEIYHLSNLIEKSIYKDPPNTINEGGIIRKGYNPKLDDLIRTSKNAKKWISDLEKKEKELTGISRLKIGYNKIFGYYIEIPKTKSKNVPDNYFCKQTLVNSSRYTTPILKEFESKIINAEFQRNTLELEIFKNIVSEVKKYTYFIQKLASFISIVDCIINFASIAHENDYCRPILNSKGLIEIKSGRHPVVEKLIKEERFVPTSIKMDNSENQILIITGPNMVGKSTILRQTALLIIMAQIGSFVPAEKANISITDKIFTRIGSLDNLAAGQSTFMMEMQETANIIKNSTKDSFIIIDELGRGTSTFDGLSIAWAIVEYLHNLHEVGVKSIFATHYHELTELEKFQKKVKTFNVAVKEFNNEIIFLRKLIKGSSNKSYGIQVADLAGMPKKIIGRAKEILKNLESRNKNLNIIQNNNTIKSPHNDIYKIKKIQKILNNQETIISSIKRIDLLKTNPIDALNQLNDLQRKVNAFTSDV